MSSGDAQRGPMGTKRKNSLKDRKFGRPNVLPGESFHYELSPALVSRLTWAHRSAGMCGGMRFSHCAHKHLEVEANRRRIIATARHHIKDVLGRTLTICSSTDCNPAYRLFESTDIGYL